MLPGDYRVKQHSFPNIQSGAEPMAVGSPSSPNQSSSISSHVQYLPGFLLGDHTPSNNQSIQSPASARPRSTSSGSAVAAKVSSSYLNLQSPQPFNGAKRFIERLDETPSSRSKDKLSAPPVSGLMDTSISATSVHVPHSRLVGLPPSASENLDFSYNPLVSGISTPLAAVSHHSVLQASHSTPAVNPGSSLPALNSSQQFPCSPAQLDPFYTQGEDLSPHDILDETWVTIFGFPPGAAMHVLQLFSEYGTIVKHVISNDGNWMHLHYQSKIAAKKALSKNGKIIGNSMMLGVSQCIDKSVMRGDSSPTSIDSCQELSLHSVQHKLPMKLQNNTSINHGPGTPTKKGTPMRLLTKAYESANSDKENSSGVNVQKGDGWWKKAMEYAFGW